LVKRCKLCGKEVTCPEHGDKYIVEERDVDGGYFYYCEKCVEEYETALGSLVHHCGLETFKKLCETGEIWEILDKMIEELKNNVASQKEGENGKAKIHLSIP